VTPTATEGVGCRQEGCRVTEDGHCLEALPNPADCPNFIAAGVTGEENAAGAESAGEPVELPAETTVRWRSGKALEPHEANDLLAERGGEVIVIAGEAESGKTTLLTVLFALLRAGSLGPYSFCESVTLLGFERRAFLASTSSFSSEEETDRTLNITDEGELLHLVLRSQEGGGDRRIQVFLTDIPGEKFRKVRNNTAAAEEIPLLSRADKLLILADGERLAGDERQAAGAEGRQLLGAILASGMLPSRTQLALVLTKYDWLVDGVEAGDPAAAYWQEELRILETNAGRSGYSIRLFETAARAKRSTRIEPGHGIVDLARWIIEPVEVGDTEPYRPLAGATRSFDRP
jgi:hypothetical protein